MSTCSRDSIYRLQAHADAAESVFSWTTDQPGYDMEEVAELVSKLTRRPRDWFDNLTDFSAGTGDTISFGGTKIGRGLLGVEGAVDTGSGWYMGGQVAGYAWWTVGGGKLVCPAGPVFGRTRYRGAGRAGILNRGTKLRIGWTWRDEPRWGLSPRNGWGPHGGKPGTPEHWHRDWNPWFNGRASAARVGSGSSMFDNGGGADG